MPKFNSKPSISASLEKHVDATVNFEGGLAFQPSDKTDLTLRVMTYLVGEPKFYGDKAVEMDEMRKLVAKVGAVEPEYVLKLASYARNEMYLRSAPIFLLVESLQIPEVKKYVKKYTPTIIRRADELTEALAYFISKHGEIGKNGKASLPNSFKDGLAASFTNFDQYQLAKYDREGTVKIRDVLRLVHPKPRSEEESATFKMVKNRTLPTPTTWETVISEKGSSKESWESVVPKMGYMAKLRNLNNFLKNNVDLNPIVKHLTNPTAVKNSKQFPFRFYFAYKVVEQSETVDPFKKAVLLQALDSALELSVDNLPKLGVKTFVAVDLSGSMDANISERSKVSRKDISSIMGALSLRVSTLGVVSAFAERFQLVPLNIKNTVLENTRRIRETFVGGATYAYKVFEYLVDNKIVVDRLILLSDMQCYNESTILANFSSGIFSVYFSTPSQASQDSIASMWEKYRRTVNSKAYLYSVDLAGYGTLQIPEDSPRTCLLAGWSDRIFEFITQYEKDVTDLVKAVENYQPFQPETVETDAEENL